MVGFDLLPLAAALLVAAAPLSSVAVHGGGAPICDSKEGACSGRTQKNVRKQATSSVASVEEDDNDDYDYESYDDDEEKEKEGCDIFLAESAVQPGKLGIFTGIRRSEGEVVGEPEVIIPILDARKNEWSPWNDMVLPADTFPQLLQESRYLNDAFVPGIGAIAACSRRFSNLAPSPGEAAAVDAAGVHRSASPAAGSFSYYHNFTFEAARDMLPGEEMVLPCPDDYDEEDYDDYYYYYRQRDGGRKVLNVDFLKDSSFCLDNLTVKKSTIEGAGRGAFAKRPVGAGQVIAHSPVLHFDRSQMEIVDQQVYPEDHWLETRRSHNIMYSETKVGQQLMLNYCYGQPASNLQPASNVLLLPYAPMVNYINANAERGKANAFVRWPSEKTKAVLPGVDAPHMKSQRPMELFAVPARGPDSHENLMIEFVAMRDILPGEEIFLMMDDEYNDAWKEHVEKWTLSADKNGSYISAADWIAAHPKESANFRTLDEQKSEPYPATTRTACFFAGEESSPDDELDSVDWEDDNLNCLRPCTILARKDAKEGGTTYTAKVMPMDRFEEPDFCEELPEGGVVVENIPTEAIRLMDKPYTSDMHQHSVVFRREMSLPHRFLPETWAAADPKPDGDFIPTPLPAGKMDRIRWLDNGEIVLQNCFRLGLDPRIRETLTDYCKKMGITEILRHVTVADNGLKAGEETTLNIRGYNWYLQRPESKWHSNLHWLSPADMNSHDHYLQALGQGGFSKMLESIGEFLDLDHLVVFHVTFIATSQSTKGFIHTDVSDTGVRTFNVIVPLIKSKNTPPELDIQEDADDGRIGRYGYELDVAVLNGDDSWHGTSAVDYRIQKDMRLAATIYIAEVTPDNVESIMADYTQAFPPPDDEELLLSWAGRHWRRDDPTATLPTPSSDHILFAEE